MPPDSAKPKGTPMKLGQILNFSREKIISPPNTKTFTVGALIVALLLPMFGYAMIQVGNSSPTRGVGDVTNAMRYEDSPGVDVPEADANDVDKIIGSPLKDIDSSMDGDDNSTKFDVTWPMNFFGTKYPSLCVTTNGTVSPLVSTSASCSNSYDETLEDFARYIKAPFIAAFANDGHPGRPLLARLAATISTAQLLPAADGASVRVLNVTTDVNHGITNGSERCLFFFHPDLNTGANTASFSPREFVFCGTFTVGAELDEFSVEVPITGYNFRNNSSSAMNLTETSSEVFAISAGASALWDSAAAELSTAQDGWGLPTTIYFGEATIDGRPAYVITWYRIGQFEQTSPDIFGNTYQIVLIQKPTTDGATLGYDFDIEYNYGTIQDGSDGYSSAEQSCDQMGSGCRTGVGISNFIESSGVLDVYELFGSTPSRDLVDWTGSTALTSNRLNSDINGRYTFTFTSGAPTTFAIPVMTGTGEVEERPEPPSLIDPIPAGVVTELGTFKYLLNDSEETLTVVPNSGGTGLVASVEGQFSMEMRGTDGGNAPAPLDADGNLLLTVGKFVAVNGSGFRPNSEIRVYLFSDPVFLGTLTTDENGAFEGSLPVPNEIAPGIHTIQANGFATNGQVRSINLGVNVQSAQVVFSSPVYNGPIVLSMTPGRAPTTGGSEIYLNGIRLDRTTGVFVNGVELEIVSKRGNELIFKTQGLPAGKYKVVVVSEEGTFTFESLVISNQAPEPSATRATTFIPGFASFSSALTPAMRSQVRQFLANHPEATLVSCKGYTSGPIRLPADERLANARSKATCDFVKQIRPELEVKVVRGKTDYRLGGQYRKLRLRVLG